MGEIIYILNISNSIILKCNNIIQLLIKLISDYLSRFVIPKLEDVINDKYIFNFFG